MNQTTYLRIISGQVPAWVGLPTRLALRMLSWPYSVVVCVRNHLYDSGRLRIQRVGVPVICVGNLTTGGTGKTPLVVWLCRYLTEKQIRCAILTRGYRSGGTEDRRQRIDDRGQMAEDGAVGRDPSFEFSDEPALLAAQCPGVAVIVNPDRIAGAAEAMDRHDAQALVMDDGFQHRRLARDLDIVAVDATRPFGYGKVLPAGLLREPIAGLRRAHAVMLTRCDQVPQDALKRIEESLLRANPELIIARSVHAPVGIKTRAGAEIALASLRGKRLFAFCGLGNPSAFFQTVTHLEGALVGSRAYDDHHRYDAGDLSRICREAAGQKAELILTTQKDWTKIAGLTPSQENIPVAYLAVELRIIAGAQELIALIDRALGGRMPTP